jgi:molybdenum cofactor cytidylyltransferase
MTSTLPIPHNLAAIVLAAGASSRMGRLKPLLPLAGVTALERAISVFHDAGIADVLVVVGNRADELRPVIERSGAHCITNTQWQQGMYSSVVAGASALSSSARAAFVLPVDVPLVRASTARQMAAAFDGGAERILYPVFDGCRGHPPLIGRSILDQAARGVSGPLSALLLAHEESAIDVPVADQAIHLDMDTQVDFDALAVLAGRRDIPTAAECEAMLACLDVPGPVLRHSRKVTGVACRIAESLHASGLPIEIDLVRAGALLHDMAKGQPKHAEVAAATLRADSMDRVARIVAAHNDIEFSGAVDERAIVYLADKLVMDDRLVTLDERFRRALNRFRDNPDALAAAQRRKAAAEHIAAAIEARLRMPLITILTESSVVPEVTA